MKGNARGVQLNRPMYTTQSSYIHRNDLTDFWFCVSFGVAPNKINVNEVYHSHVKYHIRAKHFRKQIVLVAVVVSIVFFYIFYLFFRFLLFLSENHSSKVSMNYELRKTWKVSELARYEFSFERKLCSDFLIIRKSIAVSLWYFGHQTAHRIDTQTRTQIDVDIVSICFD